MKWHRTALGIVASGLAAVLVACGGSESPTVEQGTDTSTPASVSTPPSAVVTTVAPAVAGTAACKYATTAQAAGFAGSPVKAGVNRSVPTGPVTFDSCDYILDPGNAPGVTVAVAELGGSAAALFAQFKQTKAAEADHQVVTGLGDEAFFSGQNLNVRKGTKGLILYVGRSTGSPRGVAALPDERRLADLILPQI